MRSISARNTDMAIHQTPSQRKTVKRVMHEFKHGELKTARGTRKVKNPRQAIAIALSEAGASKNDTPKERAHNLRRTKTKERRGETGQAAVEGHKRTTTRKASSSGTTRKSTARKTPRKAASGTTARKASSGTKTRAAASRSTTRKAAGS